jgi:hypothetical protein
MRGVIPPLRYEWSSTTDVIKVLGMYVTTEMVRWAGEVSCIVLGGNPERNRSLGKPRRRWWDNINIYAKGIVQWMPGVQRPEFEADHLPASSADVKNKWICTFETSITCVCVCVCVCGGVTE